MLMKRYLYAVLWLCLFLLVGQKAHAAQCGATLSANPSQQTIQNALNACGDGNYVQMSAGTTTISSSGALLIPCGVMLVGPTAAPATAKLTMSNSTHDLIYFSGSCASSNPTGASYIDFDGGTGFEADGNNHSNITITHSQFTNLFDVATACTTNCNNGANGPRGNGTAYGSAVGQFDTGSPNTINGVTFKYNTIGDSNSCANTIGRTYVTDPSDGTGGTDDCGNLKIFGQNSQPQIGHMVNLVIKYNHWTHVDEASHFYGSQYSNGNQANTCDNCDIEYNLFELVRRITVEYQMQMINHPLIVANNVFQKPINGNFNTFYISIPCCQFGSTFGSNTIAPAIYEQNNIEIDVSTNPPSDQAEWAVEYWGNGSQATNNLVQGGFCTGYEVGYPGNSVSPSVQYNTIQGAVMAGNANCYTFGGGPGTYLSPEFNNSYMGATITPNTTGSTPASIVSVAPTISPASGAVSFPLTVTLTDPGYTSPTGNYYPNGNTGIWYTIDGSTPAPGSGTAQYAATGSTITLSSAGTVKTVGMWGTPPQPTSYPSGYGFVPSSVVSATYTASGGGGGTVAFGDTSANTAGGTYPNYFNDVYAVTGVNAAGYTVNTGTVCIAPGTVTNGAKIDIGVNSAPTATTEGTTALCHATYTNTSNTSPGCVTVPLNGCGLLSSNKAYWLWTITNDPLGPSPLYFSNCGGTCNGAAPTSPGVGTYGGFYLAGTYGSYAAMSSTFTGQNSNQPSVYLGVTPAVVYGVTTTSVNFATSANYFNDVYAITGSSSGGYTVNAGTVCIAPGTVTNGAKTDIGINTAPTATTEGATALCHATYTNTSSTSPGCVTVPLTGCGTLSPNTPYWLWTITNDPIQGSPLYFSNCGSTCNSTVPTSAGVGTYGGFYLHGTYGTYTGMSSAFTGGPSPAQPSVSLSVTPH
jgi:hypothetical protein